MNTGNIKRYAPKARSAFIAAMTKRAALFGIRESSIPSMGIEPLEQKGDLALIGDRPFPASIIRPRAALVKKVEQMGFAQAMEQAAYSWFNRLCAIRFMELKGYLDHGRRVLSHPEQPGSFQILDDCLDIELEGLDPQRVAELKLDGTKDEELYHELLLAQCHALHKAMPFLFEAVDDSTELLLPDNLTKTDSLIRELVSAIPEEDWQEVEIIGWLYQFYISEKKDQVIGKVVKSEDIPAATQLFTPNWIVQYLVQNSVGRQWLQAYPDSPLKEKMPYYIEPAEQTPEVQAQLVAMTPESIDPLTIKVLDPACGSGHMLVEAYKVLKAIYEERGFRGRDIPQLILKHNLFGLDIDDRAGQLAGFALMMLARQDDRRIFTREVEFNVLSLQESSHLDLVNLWKALNLTSDWGRGQSQSLFDSDQIDFSASYADNRYQLLKDTLVRFTQAKTFGSLIEVPAEDAEHLGELLAELRQLASKGDTMQKTAADNLIPFLHQAWVLAQRYDTIVANPPYMGGKGMNADLKLFVSKQYRSSKSDLFAIFMVRAFELLKADGYNAQVNMQAWMFLSTYEKLREWLLDTKTVITLAHLGARAFSQISGEVVQTTAWVLKNHNIKHYQPVFSRLVDGNEEQKQKDLLSKDYRFTNISQDSLQCLPGRPIAYWLSAATRKAFSSNRTLAAFGEAGPGLQTSDNERFLRLWHEVAIKNIEFHASDISDCAKSSCRWFPHKKGGSFRKWYGNDEYVVNWKDDGYDIKYFFSSNPEKQGGGRIVNSDKYFKEGICWSHTSTGPFSARILEKGFIFNVESPSYFPEEGETLLALMCSKAFLHFMEILCPALHFSSTIVTSAPINHEAISKAKCDIDNYSRKMIAISKDDWNQQETSWGFTVNPIIRFSYAKLLSTAFEQKLIFDKKQLSEAIEAETALNDIFNNSFDLNGEISSAPVLSHITLLSNTSYRYSGTDSLFDSRYQSDMISELVSYVVGCIMGRYSLDIEGLVYAHSGNQSFTELVAEGAYKTFPADSDGILPLTDQQWFADDATNRCREFVRTVWGEESLQKNLDFIAESLCLYAIKPKRGESSLDNIRRYLSTQFYKDHLKAYKRRPIYWLFSSGKHRAFECLVYLHRYNEGTLARMRTEYVIPLTAKLNTYANKLAMDIENEIVTSEKKRLEKELATLHNQQAELATFDEKLRHHADQRISLDLDEGVKVNYGKFGDLLAEVKAVTGDKGV